MDPVDFEFETTVGAPREAAFAWWTDFSPGDHATTRLRGTRSDLRREGDAWTWTDEYVAMGFRSRWSFTAVLHPPQWEEYRGTSPFGRLDGIVTFGEAGRGTRVREAGTFTPRGLGVLLLPLLRRGLVRLLERDFRDHWREFEAGRATGAGPSGASGGGSSSATPPPSGSAPRP